jgi:glutathione S-transferase
MLKLYYHPLSTFSQRVRIALLEKQIPAELVEVDLLSRAQFDPEYLSKNPYGRVPTIEEDGWVLYESTAILEYLEATRPSPPLLPADVRSRAVVGMLLKLCDLEFAESSRVILLPKRFLPKERWRTDRMEEAKTRIQKHLSILETRLEGAEYLVGNRFSLAEVCYAPFLQFLPTLEVEPGPATALWAARVVERPSVRQTRPAR